MLEVKKISITDLAENISEVTKDIKKGISFVVMQRKKILFLIQPYGGDADKLSDNDVYKLDAVKDISLSELVATIEEKRLRTQIEEEFKKKDKFERINSEELHRKSGAFLKRVAKGESFLIKRNDKVIAFFEPFSEEVATSSEIITATDINRKLGSILANIEEGRHFTIRHGSKNLAILRPSAVDIQILSADEMEKLSITVGLSSRDVRIAIAMYSTFKNNL